MNALTRLNMGTAGRLGYLTGGYFLFTTLMAVVEGIAIVEIVRPGRFAQHQGPGLAPSSCPVLSLSHTPSTFPALQLVLESTPVDTILDLFRYGQCSSWQIAISSR